MRQQIAIAIALLWAMLGLGYVRQVLKKSDREALRRMMEKRHVDHRVRDCDRAGARGVRGDAA